MKLFYFLLILPNKRAFGGRKFFPEGPRLLGVSSFHNSSQVVGGGSSLVRDQISGAVYEVPVSWTPDQRKRFEFVFALWQDTNLRLRGLGLLEQRALKLEVWARAISDGTDRYGSLIHFDGICNEQNALMQTFLQPSYSSGGVDWLRECNKAIARKPFIACAVGGNVQQLLFTSNFVGLVATGRRGRVSLCHDRLSLRFNEGLFSVVDIRYRPDFFMAGRIFVKCKTYPLPCLSLSYFKEIFTRFNRVNKRMEGTCYLLDIVTATGDLSLPEHTITLKDASGYYSMFTVRSLNLSSNVVTPIDVFQYGIACEEGLYTIISEGVTYARYFLAKKHSSIPLTWTLGDAELWDRDKVNELMHDCLLSLGRNDPL